MLIPAEDVQTEIFDRIQDSLRQRTSQDTLQSRSWSMRLLKQPMVQKLFSKFPSSTGRGSTQRVWLSDQPQTITTAINLSGSAPLAMGISKAFKSGVFVHVIATLIHMQVDYAEVRAAKVRRTYFNYMYALIDEDGEVTSSSLPTSW